MSKVNMREKIFKYVKEKYKIKPDYRFLHFRIILFSAMRTTGSGLL